MVAFQAHTSKALRRFHRTVVWYLGGVLLAGVVLLVAATAPTIAAADEPVRMAGLGLPADVSQASVVINKSRVIEFDEPFESAFIAQPEIADLVPLTNQSLYILGKKLGATRLVVTDADKVVLHIVEIDVTHDLAAIERAISENIGANRIRVASANGGLLLSGEVRDAVDVQRAVAIAERFAPDAVTNALSVRSPQQVLLEVRFVEAARSASRELGVGSQVRGDQTGVDTGGQAIVPSSGPIAVEALLSGAQPFGTLVSRIIAGGTEVDLIIRALEERALARRLAEPNLVTLSGKKASFLAGGEFPIPVGADENEIVIEFKKFGVALDFTPTVLKDGRINLHIAPEVSELDPTNSVSIGGVSVPALTVRKADTIVELQDGQSLAIAGLLQHRHLKGQEQLPWLGQVPVLGALFRSAQYQREETDLVIIVTPRLVKPKIPGEKLATPLDTALPTNDPEFFVTGRAELHTAARRRGYAANFGHALTLSSHASEIYVPSK